MVLIAVVSAIIAAIFGLGTQAAGQATATNQSPAVVRLAGLSFQLQPGSMVNCAETKVAGSDVTICGDALKFTAHDVAALFAANLTAPDKSNLVETGCGMVLTRDQMAAWAGLDVFCDNNATPTTMFLPQFIAGDGKVCMSASMPKGVVNLCGSTKDFTQESIMKVGEAMIAKFDWNKTGRAFCGQLPKAELTKNRLHIGQCSHW